MTRRLLINALLVFIILFACQENSTNPLDSDTVDELQRKGSISGQVYDATTGEGIPGISVTIDSAGFSTATDSLGRYTIPNVSGGNYSISFVSSGEYHDTTLEDISLAIDEDKDSVNVAMKQVWITISAQIISIR